MLIDVYKLWNPFLVHTLSFINKLLQFGRVAGTPRPACADESSIKQSCLGKVTVAFIDDEDVALLLPHEYLK